MRFAVPIIVALAASVPASAQSTASAGDRSASLRVTVVDQTGAAIVGAALQVTPADGPSVAAATDARGQALVADLPVGSLRVHVEAPGFAVYEESIGLRRGRNARTVTLKLAVFEERVEITERDAADRRSNAFNTTLNEDDLAGFPDNPDDFEDALRQMAGGDAVFQVNGFRGGRLPPKDQIRQIRFRTNSFAAENHEAGRVFVDIITKPGMTAWNGGVNAGFRDDALNAKNAFADKQMPEQFRRFSANFAGPLKKARTSLTLAVDGTSSYDSQTIVAVTPQGQINDQVRRPVDRADVTVSVEHALDRNQTLRLQYQHRDDERRNLGVGDFDLRERAFKRESTVHQVRGSLLSVLGRSALNELRAQFDVEDRSERPLFAATAVSVIDAFTRGGASVSSQQASKKLELADNIDFTWRRHAFRSGVLLEAGRYRQVDARNGNGTFTFGSLSAFDAGRADTYTQRVGDGETSFRQYQVGLYAQDDVRIGKDLSLSVGVREEFQNHVEDPANFMPRVGFSWNPFGWKTAVRGGFGVFHDWLPPDLYDQALRVDGVTQYDLLVLQPGYPDPFAGANATVLPGGRVELAPDLVLPSIRQASIGAERTFREIFVVQAMYMRQDGDSQLRSININAPDASGVRPQPEVGTISQITSSGHLTIDRLMLNANYRLARARTLLGAHYILSETRNHADNPLALPADSRNPDAEWGPSAQDARHRLFGIFNFPLPWGVRTNVMTQAQSGLPYTVTTGHDDNADGVSNDRPPGVGRNTRRGTWRWDVNMRVSRGFGFGGDRQGAPGGGPVIQQRSGSDGDGPTLMTMTRSSQRFRVDFYAQAYNLLNRTNYVTFSGNLLSPFFGVPSSASPARRLEVGFQVAF